MELLAPEGRLALGHGEGLELLEGQACAGKGRSGAKKEVPLRRGHSRWFLLIPRGCLGGCGATRQGRGTVPSRETGPASFAPGLGLAAVAASFASSVAAFTSPSSSFVHSPSLTPVLRGTAVGCGLADAATEDGACCCCTCAAAAGFAGPRPCADEATTEKDLLRPPSALLPTQRSGSKALLAASILA